MGTRPSAFQTPLKVMAKCKVYPPFSVPLIGLRGSAHLAAMTCIRPGGCAVCQESMRDPFGSALDGSATGAEAFRELANEVVGRL